MIQLRTLGTVALRSAEGPVQAAATQPKRLALLSYLVLARPRGLHRREMLVPLFWPEMDDRRARNALSQALYGLRHALGATAFRARGMEEIGVQPDAFTCDAIDFDVDLDAGRIREALGRYEGELLEGLYITGAVGFERWLEGERARYRRRATDAASALAEREEAEDNPVAAARWLERGLEVSPDDETLFRRLAALLDRAGDRAGALRAHDRLSRHLRTQYGAEPSPETEDLISRIRGRERPTRRPVGPARPARAPVRSIAVLPLKELTGDPDQAYFADGMTEAVIGQLAKLDGVRVISRQSVIGFKDSKRPLREIADRLDVDALVEGSVLRAGDRVRVSAQLLRADPEEHLWADAYDRELHDLLGLQRDLAAAIAREIGAQIAIGGDRGSSRSVDAAAYDEFLRGIVRFPGTSSDATFEEVLGYFDRAVEQDPQFAEAHGWIAFSWCNAAYVGVCSFQEAWSGALPPARRAVELAPDLGSVHAFHGMVLQCFERDWEAADRAYAEARRLGGGDARGYTPHVLFLVGMGRFEEGIARAEEQARLDPLGPPSHAVRGWALHKARRFEEAVEQLEWTFASWPGYLWTAPFLAASHLFAGNAAGAAEACRKGLDAVPHVPPVLAYFAATLARAGGRGEAEQILTSLEKLDSNSYVDPYNLALVYAGLGDREAALARLAQLLSEGSVQSWAIPTEPFFDPLRDDPRFVEILDRLCLPKLDF